MAARSLICRLAVCLTLLPAAAAAQLEKIPWAKGPTKGQLGSEASINVPVNCLFTGVNGVRAFMEATQNNASGKERGVVLCPGNATSETWFVLFSYDESGYVRDDEGSHLDADAILASVRSGTEGGNRERKRRGWATLTVEGWATKPFYDRATNNLTWAITAHDNEGGRTVNHSVRLLGRGGLMHADLVTTPDALTALVPTFKGMIGGFSYSPGNKYAEWRSGDKVAAYGLTALVAGGAAVALAPREKYRRTDADTVRAQVEGRDLYTALFDLRVLGIVELLVLVVGVWFALQRFGTLGFFVAVGAVLLLCVVIFTALAFSAHGLGKPWRTALRWAFSYLSPFAAPRAADALLEETLRDVPPAVASAALLPADEFQRWVRPLVYDATNGREVDRRLLEGLNLKQLSASLASHNGAGLWCPRCGATFVQGESCSECDIHLVPAGTPSA